MPYSPNLFELSFSAQRLGATLNLAYHWRGEISLPAAHSELKARAHDLWQGTCFEFFLRPLTGERYFEINIAPDGHWNSYEFNSYRSSPLVESDQIKCSSISLTQERLSAEFQLGPELAYESLKTNATAVIEDFARREKFWALAHSQQGKPDFHDPEAFIYYLAP